MIAELANLLDDFPGPANQTRCFTHILNLIVKSVIRQFDLPKSKGEKILDDAAKELPAILNSRRTNWREGMGRKGMRTRMIMSRDGSTSAC